MEHSGFAGEAKCLAFLLYAMGEQLESWRGLETDPDHPGPIERGETTHLVGRDGELRHPGGRAAQRGRNLRDSRLVDFTEKLESKMQSLLPYPAYRRFGNREGLDQISDRLLRRTRNWKGHNQRHAPNTGSLVSNPPRRYPLGSNRTSPTPRA